MSDTNDDISLREIYLIIRKYLWFLVFIPLLIAVIVFVVFAFSQSQYKAEAVTLVTPSPIRIGGSNSLAYRPTNEVSFETYETLAESRGVKEAAIASLDLDMDYTELTGEIRQLVGPRQPDQIVALLVSHEVQSVDPEEAAMLANAWARASLDTINQSLLSNLDPLVAQISVETQTLKEKLELSEDAIREFAVKDNSRSLELNLNQLAQLIANAENGMVTISELGQQNISFNLALQGEETTLNNSNAYLNIKQEMAANTAYIEALEQEPQTASIQADLSQRRALASALQARQASLVQDLSSYKAKQTELQEALAGLNQEKATLERDLLLAQTAFNNVVALEPNFEFLSRITPSNTQILNAATVPTQASGSSALINALIALFVAFVATLLFVFLREAVSAKT